VPRPRNNSALGLLRLLLAASVAVPLVLFLVSAWIDYNEVLREAKSDLARTSEVMRENAARVFERQRDMADGINDIVTKMTVPDVLAAEHPLHQQFAAMVAHIPEIQSVLLVAATGKPLVSATFYPVNHTVNVGARDYFKGAMAQATGRFISTVQVGEIIKRVFFGFAQRWTGPDGQTKGIIDIAISPAFFQDFYRLLVNEEGDYYKGKSLALIRNDGQILVRYPPSPNPLPRLPPPSPFFPSIARNPDGGFYNDRSLVDAEHPHRIYAYRSVSGFPLYVVAGRSRAAILAVWWRTIFGRLAIGVPGTLALFLVARTALIRTRREEEALAQADAEMLRRERAEQMLLRTQRLEAVGQLTGGVAHDFNNLLTVIIGSVELLERRPDDGPTVRRLARNIKAAAERGAEITTKLLSFSRQNRVNPKIVNVNESLRAFEPLLRQAANESVTIDFDLGDEVVPAFLDSGQFEAAILNLVGNARDAMPHGGRITIATRSTIMAAGHSEIKPGPAMRIIVTDDGMGMDADTAAKAIEPFFTTKGVGRGTGLGLSQVYGFARQSGGDLRIKTAPGRGTSVEILLPGTDVTANFLAAETAPEGSRAQPSEVVLVVEDEPDVRDIAVEGLRALGYTTLSAGNADMALDILRRESRVDLLFSDVVMPGTRNGVQLCDEARRLRPGLRVLLTSGYNTVIGATPANIRLLAKPYDNARLAERVREALDD
jgi:signal transduction histidine kinase/CheY-like chemotaxis protein